jgi:hypothetical protein
MLSNSIHVAYLSNMIFLKIPRYARGPSSLIIIPKSAKGICSCFLFLIKLLSNRLQNSFHCLLNINSMCHWLNNCALRKRVCYRSLASSQNAGGAKLLRLANGISSSIVAGQFMKIFQDEVDSMKAEEAVYCALHEQGEYPTIQHHYKILGFPFSEYSCSMEIQTVVNLLTALLSRADEASTSRAYPVHVFEKVCIQCSRILPS